MIEILKYVIKKVVDWFTRPKSPFVLTFRASSLIVGAIVGLGNLTGTLTFRDYSFQLTDGGSISDVALTFVLVLSSLLMFLSFVVMAWEKIGDVKASRGKSVMVIEGRGLRDDDGETLAKALGKEYPLSRNPYLLDLRQRLDGKIISAAELLPKIPVMKEAVQQARKGHGRESIQIAYGGLTAVPFTFLTGVELDDEGEISVFDWDRTKETWRALDDEDDGKRFLIPNIGESDGHMEVLLAVSVSYPISQDDLNTTFDLPVYHLALEDGSFDSHWSQSKQSALATQFTEFVKNLSGIGVEKNPLGSRFSK